LRRHAAGSFIGKMDPAELIAIGITKVGELDRTHRLGLARAGRAVNRGAAVGDGGVVQLPHLLGRVARRCDGAAVCDSRWFIVDRFADDEVRPIALL